MIILPAKNEYSELSTIESFDGIVYGPLTSRRFGHALGVNLAGGSTKVCSFNCPYCDLGASQLTISHIKKEFLFPTIDAIEEQISHGIVDATKRRIPVETILISGNGEPTLHPDLYDVLKKIVQLRDQLLESAHIVILTNGAHLDNSKTIRAINLIDERFVKLDAGSENLLRRMNNPLVRINIAKIIQGAKKLHDVNLQSMFVQGLIDNTNPAEVDEWIESVGIIRPKLVQICTIDTVPFTSGLKPVAPQKLKEIGQTLTRRTQIKASVFS